MVQQDNVKLAFNLGVYQFVKEAEIDPVQIIQMAEETQDPELMAAAEALLELAAGLAEEESGGVPVGGGMEGAGEGMDPSMAGPPPGMEPGMEGMEGEEEMDPEMLAQLAALVQGA